MLKKEDKNYMGLDIKLLDNEQMKYWIRWYLDGAKKEDFKKWGSLTDDMEYSLKYYPYRVDVQRCIVDYTKRNKDMDLINVYNIMLKNALNGDVQAANWIVQFSKSDFFYNKSNELEDFVEGLSLNE